MEVNILGAGFCANCRTTTALIEQVALWIDRAARYVREVTRSLKPRPRRLIVVTILGSVQSHNEAR
jgi:hypothetical protein